MSKALGTQMSRSINCN